MSENGAYGDWVPAEIQTMIDECSDGQWEGVILVGSNHHLTVHRPTFAEAASALDDAIARLEAQRAVGRRAASGSTAAPKPPQ